MRLSGGKKSDVNSALSYIYIHTWYVSDIHMHMYIKWYALKKNSNEVKQMSNTDVKTAMPYIYICV